MMKVWVLLDCAMSYSGTIMGVFATKELAEEHSKSIEKESPSISREWEIDDYELVTQ